MKSSIRHFLDLADIDAATLRHILTKRRRLRPSARKGKLPPLLAGKKLAMIFEKNSTRTRVSFEVAMMELGGHALSFNGSELQLGRGETVADTARVLSRYVDAIMLRCHSHDKLLELAANAAIPVINGLTEFSHPCQIMADILTFEEHLGPIKGKTIAWVGDGNNVAQSWIQAAALFGCTLRLACPQKLPVAGSGRMGAGPWRPYRDYRIAAKSGGRCRCGDYRYVGVDGRSRRRSADRPAFSLSS